MKKCFLSVASIALLSMASSTYADANNLKVGIVNVAQVIAKSSAAMSLNEKLSKEFKSRQEAVNVAQKHIQDEVEQLTFNSYKMTADERAKLQATVNTDKRNFEAMNISLQKDLTAAQSDDTRTFSNMLMDAISKVAQKNHYDIIESRSNALYVSDDLDITSQIIQQIDS